MKLNEVLNEQILNLNKQNACSLKRRAESGEITWVLGAGISVPAGLPQWGELLAKMWARLMDIEMDKADDEAYFVFEEARMDIQKKVTDDVSFQKKVNLAYKGEYKHVFSDINVLESAEYLWNYICGLVPDHDGLQVRILKALIKSSLNISVNRKTLMSDLENEAVGVLAKILASQKHGNVITYNYDDLLEFCLETIAKLDKKSNPEAVRVVCDSDLKKGDHDGKINIYHPHGAVNIAGSAWGKESKNIILTESSYYNMERKAYNWENSVQAKALMETTCIFTGFSGEDYNFRRIIKNIDFSLEKDLPKHYIFFCIDDLVKIICGNALKKRYPGREDEMRKELIQSEEFAYERIQLVKKLYAQYYYWERHGILPIWSTFEELPCMIRKLAKSVTVE